MQASSDTNPPSQATSSSLPSPAAAREPVTLYHWGVFILAAAGWLFDCMGQRVFVLSREPALKELLGAAASDNTIRLWGSLATGLMMVGWATGGILFGLFSDRYGRVKAMVTTLLAYTVFSGLSGFARTGTEFLIWRLLFGLGVGGMFGAATTLVAESVPKHFRTVALGSMQALSACGNMLASGLSLKVVPGQENFWSHYSGWQVLSFVSVFPALFAVPMLLILREPEPWKKARAAAASGGAGKAVGSLPDLFRDFRWRKNLLVGVCLGVSGMVGLWGIAFFSPELITTAFKTRPLMANEVRDATALGRALATGTNPAAAHIATKLPVDLVKELNGVKPGDTVSPVLLETLLRELNRAIQQEMLYDEAAFRDINLKKSTKNLLSSLAKNPQASDLILLNRQLLEQVVPGAIQELQKTIDKTRSRGTLFQDVGSLAGMFAFTFVASVLGRRGAFLASFLLCLATVSFVFYSLKTEVDVYWMLPLMGFATLSAFAGYSIYFPELFPTRLRGTGVGFCYNTVRYLAAPFPILLGWLSSLMPFRVVAIMMCGIYLLGVVALIWAPETKGKPLPED